MLSWTEIAADVGQHFMAVKRADERVHVQSAAQHCWVALELIQIVGIENVMLSARVSHGLGSDEEPAVRVMLPIERLDWSSLKAACEEAARVANALGESKEDSKMESL
jgi:hypothetical protein